MAKFVTNSSNAMASSDGWQYLELIQVTRGICAGIELLGQLKIERCIKKSLQISVNTQHIYLLSSPSTIQCIFLIMGVFRFPLEQFNIA